MFRNRQGRRGLGRGPRDGRGYAEQGEAGYGRGRGGMGYGPGRGWGRGANWQTPSDLESGLRWNRSVSSLTEDVPPAERKSWLEKFKAHLTQRMSEVNEELKKY